MIRHIRTCVVSIITTLFLLVLAVAPAEVVPSETPHNGLQDEVTLAQYSPGRSPGTIGKSLPPGFWRSDPSQAIANEIERIAEENPVKYGALFILVFYPPTTLMAKAAIKTELVRDVAEATGRGFINAMNLSAMDRQKALFALANLKGSNDFASFINDLASIANLKDAAMLWAVLPATIKDLDTYLGADKATSLGLFGPGFMVRIAGEFTDDECEFDAARYIYGDARQLLERDMMPNIRRNILETYALLSGQPVDTRRDPASLPMVVHKRQFDRMQINPYSDFHVARYNHYQYQYRQGTELLRDISEKLPRVADAEKQYDNERPKVESQLEKAHELLWECHPEDGMRVMNSIRDRYFVARITTGPAIARKKGCWGWAEQPYNKIMGDYWEWGAAIAAERDSIGPIQNKGIAALQACRMRDGLNALSELEALMSRSRGRCTKKAYDSLRLQIERIQREGLCNDAAASRMPTGKKSDDKRPTKPEWFSDAEAKALMKELWDKYNKKWGDEWCIHREVRKIEAGKRGNVNWSGCAEEPLRVLKVLTNMAWWARTREKQHIVRSLAACYDPCVMRDTSPEVRKGCYEDCNKKNPMPK